MTAPAAVGGAVAGAPLSAAPLRVLNLGISSSPICGVRDYARVVGTALSDQGLEVSTLWCDTVAGPLARRRKDVRAWLDALALTVRESPPDALILHYSVFEYGIRGLPIFAPVVARALRRTRVPVVGVLHEFAYPFGRRRWRGALQAISHRAVLPAVIRACDALLVTTEDRVEWLQTRTLLPRRPTSFAPVCSNVPAAREVGSDRRTVGVLGFGSERIALDTIVDAIGALPANVRVLLIGAPGSESARASRWRNAFVARGRGETLSFSGILSERELADAIGGTALVVLPDADGVSSRRGTLAAALAASKPVVAFEGPESWRELLSEHAIVAVPPEAARLAEELAVLLEDSDARDEQSARAEDFYRRCMAPEVAASAVLRLLPQRVKP